MPACVLRECRDILSALRVMPPDSKEFNENGSTVGYSIGLQESVILVGLARLAVWGVLLGFVCTDAANHSLRGGGFRNDLM